MVVGHHQVAAVGELERARRESPGERQPIDRDVGADRRRAAVRRGPDHLAPPGTFRIGHDHAPDRVDRTEQNIASEATREPGGPMGRAGDGRGAARQGPPERRRERGKVRPGQLPEQGGDELSPLPVTLARQVRLRLRVSLDRLGRQPVDVGEDRLGEPRADLVIDAGALRHTGETPPRDPRADPIRGLKRVERAPGPQFAASQHHVHLA